MRDTIAWSEKDGVVGVLTASPALTPAMPKAGGRFGICGIGGLCRLTRPLLWMSCGRWEGNPIGMLDCKRTARRRTGMFLTRSMHSISRIMDTGSVGWRIVMNWREVEVVDKPRKTCDTCEHSCYPPTSMKPVYGLGGMMLVCCKPRKRRKNMIMVAPEYKCRDWTQKQSAEGTT